MADNGTPVKLYIYDLTKGLARSMSLPLLGKQIDGVWHTGIVVYGEEFFFGGTGGIEKCPPCGTMLGQPDRVLDLGSTQVPKELFMDYLEDLSVSTFGPQTYQLFSHNCNNFSDEVSQFLTGKKIPAYITSLPAEVLNTPLGAMIRPMIEAMNVQPSGGHTLFPSNEGSATPPKPPQSSQSTKPSQQTPSAQKGSTGTKTPTTNKSVDILQTPASFIVNLCEQLTTMKGEECQGTIQGATSSVGLNLWNETLEYLQTKNPSWSLSKDHLHTIGKILLDKSIKNKAWMSTCYMLQNLLLIGDFIPVIVNSSENTLEKILCSYQSYQPEYQDCVVRVLVNLLNSVAGRTFVFGSENGKILVKYCVQICCNGLLGGTTNLLFKRCAALAFNISFEDTGDEIEVEICSAITAALKESIDDKTAIYLLCCLLRIMERNQEVKCLISVMGFEWPNLTKLSDEVKNMHASLKVLCSSS